MRTFQVVVERDPETGLLVGYVPGWPGAHTQAEDSRELEENLREVIEMLLEDGEPQQGAWLLGSTTRVRVRRRPLTVEDFLAAR